MFGNLDPAKLLVILVIALVVLGPERLPKLARQLGAAWRELTRMREQVTEEVRSAMPDFANELPPIPRIKPGSITGFLSDLTRPGAVAKAGMAAGAAAVVGAGRGTSAAGTSSGGAGDGGAGDGAATAGAAGGLGRGDGSPDGEQLLLAGSSTTGPDSPSASAALDGAGHGSLAGTLAGRPLGRWASQAPAPVGLDDPAMN